MTNLSIEQGQLFEVECPFVRIVYTEWEGEESTDKWSWRPGIEWEPVAPYGEESTARAHGIGKVRYTVVFICSLPRPYPTRVFFTRKWVSPDGKEFGTGKLHILAREAFVRRTLGYVAGGTDGAGEFDVIDMTDDERRKALA